MAKRTETRIKDVHVDVGFDELDRSKVIMTLTANICDNDGAVIHSYREDITSEVTAEDMTTLAPLIERAIAKVMLDRQITPEDLAEGETAARAERERAAQTEGPPPEEDDEEAPPQVGRLMSRMAVAPSDDPSETMTEEEARDHQEKLAEQNRQAAAEAEAAHEADVQRQIEAGERYIEEQRLVREAQERERAELRKQDEQAKGSSGAPVRVDAEPRRPTR